MRLIDADALIHRLLNTKIVSANLLQYATAVTNMIGEAPTIDAEPVRHGRWKSVHEIVPGISAGQCSECSRCDFVKNYCPNCGAKMDKEG